MPITKGDGAEAKGVEINEVRVELVGDDHVLSGQCGRVLVLEVDSVRQRVLARNVARRADAARARFLVRIIRCLRVCREALFYRNKVKKSILKVAISILVTGRRLARRIVLIEAFSGIFSIVKLDVENEVGR